MAVSNFGYRFYVDNIGIRVSECFDKYGFGVLLNRFFKVGKVARIDESGGNAIIGQSMRQ